MSGQVIGVNSMFVEGGENLNFAIPVNDAKALLQRQSAKVQPLPNEVPRDVISKATPKEIPPAPKEAPPAPKEVPETIPKGISNAHATPEQERDCWDWAAKAALGARTDYYPDEPRVEYASHYDTASARCYVESKFYWDNGKKNPPNETATSVVFVANTAPNPKIHAYLLLGPSSIIWGCEVLSQHCNSKEQFAELVSKTFRMPPPMPPNTKPSASMPSLESASKSQIAEDLKYCHKNPKNNLLIVGLTSVISCKDATALIKREGGKHR